MSGEMTDFAKYKYQCNANALLLRDFIKGIFVNIVCMVKSQVGRMKLLFKES